ncbi:MAG TPA: hypothetical protein VKD90_15025 [Gemmataceae bacterium]|nr:hypothetical protein [Gemmataceae bacterium]
MARCVVTCLMAFVAPLSAVGDEAKWVTVKGKIVWDAAKGPAPNRDPVKADKDAALCAMDKEFLTESWVIHPKTGGIKNVIVWLGPDLTAVQAKELETRRAKPPTFDPKDVHPDLAKPAKPDVEIDQPCCRFIPHVLAMQEGQNLVIKNSAPALHNARFDATESGIAFNQIIPTGQPVTIKGLKPERLPIVITCSVHSWMSARLAVFPHPYFAVTDEDGNFEIKDAPVLDGKLRLYAWQESIGYHGGVPGRYGKSFDVKGPATDVGAIKLEFADAKKEKK